MVLFKTSSIQLLNAILMILLIKDESLVRAQRLLGSLWAFVWILALKEVWVWDLYFVWIMSVGNFDNFIVESRISNSVGYHKSFACTVFQTNLDPSGRYLPNPTWVGATFMLYHAFVLHIHGLGAIFMEMQTKGIGPHSQAQFHVQKMKDPSHS